ncbi:hypothetical protein LSI54_08945 [Nesterenkonia sp. AY15]|uniref:hypothetical protein n=1 Tax=Nesterenkonia sp. AY15 TaxID=2901139 RepID=UPI001F4D0FA1|nr:hypothetical protein [Nesterenkonia sp. AY15]MCH8571477.1 hypothetical protein [Nesterenkonia sp. AY15]
MEKMTMIRRAAAGGAALSGLLHLLMLSHGPHLGWALAMAVMAIICLPCAGHLWRVPSPRSWITIAAMNATMLGMHLWVIAGPETGHPEPAVLTSADEALVAGHPHGPAGSVAAGVAPDAGAATTSSGTPAEHFHHVLLPLASGLAAMEIVLAVAALIVLRRRDGGTPSMQAGRRALHAESTSRRTGGPILITAPSATDEGVTR